LLLVLVGTFLTAITIGTESGNGDDGVRPDGLFRSSEHGFTLILPPEWRIASHRLVAGLTERREILSAGTGPMVVGRGGNCGRYPTAAMARLDPGDVLISIQERRSARGDPRPSHLARWLARSSS
jgi:hypothetical protein